MEEDKAGGQGGMRRGGGEEGRREGEQIGIQQPVNAQALVTVAAGLRNSIRLDPNCLCNMLFNLIVE